MLLKYLLLGPLSLLYGLGVDIRNRLFDRRLLKIREFDVPIICIGNITVGGTGKTPHTEALIGELRRDFRVACLSRGYKRRTSGFVLATPESTAKDIGDEPMQIKSKFPDIIVAVDGNRARAIERLSQSEDKPEVIILDDGFQHRSVKADINILLVDFNRPVNEDHLLPLGRLRESVHAMGRANYVIVTKCPANISPIEKGFESVPAVVVHIHEIRLNPQDRRERGGFRAIGGQHDSLRDRHRQSPTLSGTLENADIQNRTHPLSRPPQFQRNRHTADNGRVRSHTLPRKAHFHDRKRRHALKTLRHARKGQRTLVLHTH